MEADEVRRKLTVEPAGAAVRLERHLDARPEQVWSACTDPDRLRRWLGVVIGRPAAGSTVTLAMTADDVATCRLDRCEAPRLLVCGWREGSGPDTVLRLELTAEGAGTRLVLEHRGLAAAHSGGPDGDTAGEGTAEPAAGTGYGPAGYGAGWEDYLRALGEHLDHPDGSVAHVAWADVEATVLPHWQALVPTTKP